MLYAEAQKLNLENPKTIELLSHIPVNIGDVCLRSSLEPHQIIAIVKLYLAKRIILGDEMRLGKSIITLSLCKILQSKNPESKFLFIMPNYLKYNFKSEILKWFPHEKVLIINTEKDLSKIVDYDFIIINYDKFGLLPFKNWKLDQFEVVALDEAHRFKVKMPSTKGTASTAKMTLELYQRLENYTGRLIFMTGSPVSNSFADIYGMLKLLIGVDKFEFGNYIKFANRFTYKIERYFRHSQFPIISYKGFKESEMPTMKALLNKYMLRRTLLEIYPYNGEALYTTIRGRSKMPVGNYEMLENIIDRVLEANEMGNPGAVLNSMDLSLIYKAHFALKETEICDIIKDNSIDGKIIVVNPYIETVERMHNVFKDSSAGYINANVPIKHRQGIVDSFRNDKDKKVLFATISTIAEGLDFSFCDTLFITQPTFDTVMTQQLVKRLDNIKRTTRYKIIHHILIDSFEEIIFKSFINKTISSKRVVNTELQNTEEWGNFALNELREMKERNKQFK